MRSDNGLHVRITDFDLISDKMIVSAQHLVLHDNSTSRLQCV